MMIGIVLAAAIGMQDAPQTVDASKLFSKMLARYNAAQSVSGTITFTQTADVRGVPRKLTIETKIQGQKPNKLYLWQTPSTSVGTSGVLPFFAISDGKQVCYTAPPQWAGNKKIYEPAGKDFDTLLASFSLLMIDRGFPEALAAYSNNEIKDTVYRLRDLKDEGAATIEGRSARKIRSTYIISDGVIKSPDVIAKIKTQNVPPSLTVCYFYITNEGDLLAINREEMVGGGPLRDQTGRPVQQESFKVSSQWIVDLKIDQPVDASLFTIPR